MLKLLILKLLDNRFLPILLVCTLLPTNALSNSNLLEAVDSDVFSVLSPTANEKNTVQNIETQKADQQSEMAIVVLPVDLSSLYSDKGFVQQAQLPASYVVDELNEQRLRNLETSSMNKDVDSNYIYANVFNSASDDYFDKNEFVGSAHNKNYLKYLFDNYSVSHSLHISFEHRSDSVVRVARLVDISSNEIIATLKHPVSFGVGFTAPEGLTISLRQCISSANAISCDVDIQSDLSKNGRLIVHGVYWKNGNWRPEKSVLLSKKYGGATSEISVYPQSTVSMSSLLVTGVHDEIPKGVSLGINYTFQNIEFFFNTNSVLVLASTG